MSCRGCIHRNSLRTFRPLRYVGCVTGALRRHILCANHVNCHTGISQFRDFSLTSHSYPKSWLVPPVHLHQ